tara:strand:- start:565 stop:858 length:294 start_codon:yes stop_codon:yes gene_type:complete
VNAISHYIFDLKKQVDLLLSRYEELRLRNIKIDNEKEILLKKVNDLEREVKELTKRLEVVDVVQGISVKDGDSASFARTKINNLIREIDKCISLLNE